MSGYLWTILGALIGGPFLTVLGDMASQEIRDRLDHIPHAILRIAARRLSPDQHTTVYQNEWLPELAYILEGYDTRPITRIITGTLYALGILIAASRIASILNRPASPNIESNIPEVSELPSSDTADPELVSFIDRIVPDNNYSVFSSAI
jgi:hypothetical protein